MTYLSPVIAIVATLFLGALLFLALGKDPLAGLKVFLVDPFNGKRAISELLLKSDTADPVRAGAGGMLPRQHLEHRRRRPVHGRRALFGGHAGVAGCRDTASPAAWGWCS
jgi:hypothetical protein